MTIYLDYETTSKTDLLTQGLARYTSCPTTEILCLGWCIDDGPIECWFPEDEPFPQELNDHIATGADIVAHNALFDMLITDYVLVNDFPEAKQPKYEQWLDSMLLATASGLPASLGDICKALDLPVQKQKEGARLIREYSTQGRRPWMNNDKQLMEDYCKMDVETMRCFCSLLRPLSDRERKEWRTNANINMRGIPIDTEQAKASLSYANDVKADADKNIFDLTGGQVATARARKSRDEWLVPKLDDEQLKLITKVKDGKEKLVFDKAHRQDLAEHPNLPEEVSQFIEFVEIAGGSSTSKYKAAYHTELDGRVHYNLQFHGAATGRWTSKGLQVHNMPRDALDDPEPIIADLKKKTPLSSPAKTLSRLLRSMITHKDGISWVDWSAIEARMLPWLADSEGADKVLDIFREDRDLYVATAEAMGMGDRQAGKIASLSLGYGGGVNALLGMAKNYGVYYTEAEGEDIVYRYRTGNQWVVDFWNQLQTAAENAVKQPGTTFYAGRIAYQYDGADWLWCMRPSGNLQAYYQPRFELSTPPWGGEPRWALKALAGSVKPKAGEPWPRRVLTRGILAENVTQGASADLLRHCVLKCEEAKLPLIFHVHDEIVCEGNHLDALIDIMTNQRPEWADSSLPLKAEGEYKTRYGK